MTGTVVAPGSWAPIHSLMADISTLSAGELLPTTCSVKSMRRSSDGSPST